MYCKTSIYCILVYFLYNYAKNSQNPGKSALMIMVIVKSVIFFGKSVKNIWNLDFFKYNHKYKTVKTAKQIYSWNSITAITVITDTTAITWNSITAKAWNSRTDTTVITAITCNSRADTTAITWNGITAKQLSQIKQDNSKILFLRYGVISWQNGK